MKVLSETVVEPNAGWMEEVTAGQIVRIAAMSVIDFIAFNRADRSEWFDTARTRVYNLNIFPTAGQRLFSKHNNPMMRILADGFAGIGRHDLQSGHACAEAMLAAVAPLGVRFEDLPDPLGLFRNMDIEQSSGRMTAVPLGPPAPVDIELEAEIDLICALVNCPDPATSAAGAAATVTVFEA